MLNSNKCVFCTYFPHITFLLWSINEIHSFFGWFFFFGVFFFHVKAAYFPGGPVIRTLASLVAQLVKNLPAMQETWVQSLALEDLLEKGKATCFHGLNSPWDRKESDTTERLSLHCTAAGLGSVPGQRTEIWQAVQHSAATNKRQPCVSGAGSHPNTDEAQSGVCGLRFPSKQWCLQEAGSQRGKGAFQQTVRLPVSYMPAMASVSQLMVRFSRMERDMICRIRLYLVGTHHTSQLLNQPMSCDMRERKEAHTL